MIYNGFNIILLDFYQSSNCDYKFLILFYVSQQTLNPVQSTLKHLDLSRNRISTISDSQLNQVRF